MIIWALLSQRIYQVFVIGGIIQYAFQRYDPHLTFEKIRFFKRTLGKNQIQLMMRMLTIVQIWKVNVYLKMLDWKSWGHQ